MNVLATVVLCFALIACVGCHSSGSAEQTSPSNLTPGMAKKTIVKGQTTQAEVTEVFGPPDLVTHRDGTEIWTYDKIRYDVQSSGGYLSVLIAGTSSSRTSSSSVSTMLIIYFDSRDVVTDYRLSTVKF